MHPFFSMEDGPCFVTVSQHKALAKDFIPLCELGPGCGRRNYRLVFFLTVVQLRRKKQCPHLSSGRQ